MIKVELATKLVTDQDKNNNNDYLDLLDGVPAVVPERGEHGGAAAGALTEGGAHTAHLQYYIVLLPVVS